MSETKLEDLEEFSIHYLSNMNPPPEGRCYVVMVPNGWGRDATAYDAYYEALKHGSRPSGVSWAVLFDAPEGTYVDELGYFRWKDASRPEPRPLGRIRVRRS